MSRIRMKQLCLDPHKYKDSEILVCGWVRTIRDSKALGFIELNDGSILTNLQIVFEDGQIDNFKEIAKPQCRRGNTGYR